MNYTTNNFNNDSSGFGQLSCKYVVNTFFILNAGIIYDVDHRYRFDFSILVRTVAWHTLRDLVSWLGIPFSVPELWVQSSEKLKKQLYKRRWAQGQTWIPYEQHRHNDGGRKFENVFGPSVATPKPRCCKTYNWPSVRKSIN